MVVQVLAAGFQGAGAWYAVVLYDLVEAGIGFVGMAEAENRRMTHSGNLEAHSGIEVEARSETAVDHFEIESVVRSGKEAAHFGIVEDRSGMEEDHSGTEEAVHSETEVGSRARLARGIVEAAQTLEFEVEQNSAVAEEMEIAVVDRAVVAERRVEERQSMMGFEVDLQMASAAAAEGSLASRPYRNFLV